jgi:LAO/AO transport system ATPase
MKKDPHSASNAPLCGGQALEHGIARAVKRSNRLRTRHRGKVFQKVTEWDLRFSKRAQKDKARLVEEGLWASVIEMLKAIYPHAGKAFLIGITGPAGAGKSTLVSRMIVCLRGRGLRMGVVAVDPSSARSGGALLGDRIRVRSVAGDPGVFFRSMAARERLGGLADATRASVTILGAVFDVVLVETVGVGQSEMEVAEIADTTGVVLVPESGDGVQMMKAGLMEAGDIFVINKFDREGGSRLEREIRGLLEMVADRRPAGSLFRCRRPAASATGQTPRPARRPRHVLVAGAAGGGLHSACGPGRDVLLSARRHWQGHPAVV